MRKATKRLLNETEISIFCDQMALMLTAGIPVCDGVDALRTNGLEGMKGDGFSRLSDTLRETGLMAKAVEASGLFPEYMVHMTQVGEQTGKLQTVMRSLSDYYQRESRVRRALSHAVVYPCILLVMMACVITVLIIRVMPVFRQVLDSMGPEAGLPAGSLMKVGTELGYAILAIVFGMLLVAAALFALYNTPARKKVMRFLCAAFPPTRRLAKDVAEEKFAGAMSVMVSCGFPIDEAMSEAPAIVGEEATCEKLKKIYELMNKGCAFQDALMEAGVFEPLYCGMLRVGFTAGQEETSLCKMVEICEARVEDGFSRLISAVEPTLFILFALMVGAILLAAMLPMAGLLAGIA